MADPFIGEIKIFPYNFVPYGFLACQGQILAPAQNSALFALIGTNFGGNGVSTFYLPNLSGNASVGQGRADGGTIDWTIGLAEGAEQVTINITEYPLHTHTLSLPVTAANTAVPVSGAAMTSTKPGEYFCAPVTAMNTTMHQNTLTPNKTTPALAHENRQPYLVLEPCIATMGVFPVFS